MKHRTFIIGLSIFFLNFILVLPAFSSVSLQDLGLIDEYLSKDMSTDDSVALSAIVLDHIKYQGLRKDGQDTFLAISEHFKKRDQDDTALLYFEFASKFLSNESEVKGQLFYYLGKWYNHFNHTEKSLMALQTSLNLVSGADYLFKNYTQLSLYYVKRDLVALAEKFAFKALQQAENSTVSIEDKFELHLAFISVYMNKNDFTKVDYHLMRIKQYASMINDHEHFAKMKFCETGIYFTKNKTKEGEIELAKIEVEKLSNKLKNIYYFYKTVLAVNNDDPLAAIEYCKLSLSETRGVGTQKLALSHTWMAVAYEIMCDIEKAIYHNKKSLSIYQEQNDLHSNYINVNYRKMGHYYVELGNLTSALQNFEKAREYSSTSISHRIYTNTDLIFMYGQLLYQDFSVENMDSIFSLMDETHQHIFDWNFKRHYIDDDKYKEEPIRNFYEVSLNILHHIYGYTAHPLISDRIIQYTTGHQSLIYKNNKIKHDPFYDSDVLDEFRIQERKLKTNIAEIKKEYDKCMNIHDNLNVASRLFYLDSINVLTQHHKQYINTNLPDQKKLFFGMDLSTSTVKEIQQELDEDEAVINYFDGEDNLYSTVITEDDVFFFKKEITPYIKDLVNIYTQEIAHPDFSSLQCFEDSKHMFMNTSFELFTYLMESELKNISPDIKHLFIVSSWMLESLPFKVMLTELPDEDVSYKDLPYLINKYSIVYDYSLESFLHHKKKERKVREKTYVGFSPDYEPIQDNSIDSLVAVLDSDQSNFASFVLRGGLVNLPGAKRCVIDVADQFKDGIAITGSNVSKGTFYDYLGKSDIIQLAMHAVIDKENPELSQFVFSGVNEDHNLFAYEIFDLEVDAEIAMLSACDTGRGEAQSGKSIQSISQAFSFAGSSSLTMSYYKIPDDQTASIDNYFIENIRKGNRLDESLRLSNLKYLKKSSEKYAHPFYWAGIVLAGKAEPLKQKSFLYKILDYMSDAITET